MEICWTFCFPEREIDIDRYISTSNWSQAAAECYFVPLGKKIYFPNNLTMKFCSHMLSPSQWHVSPSAFFRGFGSEKTSTPVGEATCPGENTKD